VCRYVNNADPVVSVESLPESVFNGEANPEDIVVFAVVDVPLGSVSVTDTMIEYFERDEVDTLGRLSFRGTLTNTGSLPDITTNANRAGDFYTVSDGVGGLPEIHTWDGTDWVNVTQTQALTSLLDNHINNLSTNAKHLTDNQFDAVAGTVDSPSSANKFVAEIAPSPPITTLKSFGMGPEPSNEIVGLGISETAIPSDMISSESDGCSKTKSFVAGETGGSPAEAKTYSTVISEGRTLFGSGGRTKMLSDGTKSEAICRAGVPLA